MQNISASLAAIILTNVIKKPVITSVELNPSQQRDIDVVIIHGWWFPMSWNNDCIPVHNKPRKIEMSKNTSGLDIINFKYIKNVSRALRCNIVAAFISVYSVVRLVYEETRSRMRNKMLLNVKGMKQALDKVFYRGKECWDIMRLVIPDAQADEIKDLVQKHGGKVVSADNEKIKIKFECVGYFHNVAIPVPLNIELMFQTFYILANGIQSHTGYEVRRLKFELPQHLHEAYGVQEIRQVPWQTLRRRDNFNLAEFNAEMSINKFVAFNDELSELLRS